ncbi:hypothetical protein G9A89_001782 [Geosiphon pyriformis]|nr:hypothetical protein G9A89_001782 [Geosiphon pyriformis]
MPTLESKQIKLVDSDTLRKRTSLSIIDDWKMIEKHIIELSILMVCYLEFCSYDETYRTMDSTRSKYKTDHREKCPRK